MTEPQEAPKSQQVAEPTPAPAPVMDVFAGGDAIEEENLGNIEDFYDHGPFDGATTSGLQTDVPPPQEQPQQPPANNGEPAGDAPAAAAPEGTPAPQDTAAEGQQVPDQEQHEPPADPANNATEQPQSATPSQVPDGAGNGEVDGEGQVPSFRLAQEAARRRQAEAYAAEMERRLQAANANQQQMAPQAPPVQATPVSQQPAPQGQAPAPEAKPLDLGDDPKQMFDKALDGDLDKATELFQDMMAKAVASNVQQPQQQQLDQGQLDQIVAQRVNAMRMREDELAVINDVESTYEVFNPSSQMFDKKLVDETLALKATYEGMHYLPAEAMQRAVAMVTNIHGIAVEKPALTPAQQEAATKTNPAVKRNLEAQNAQPPEMPKGASQQTAEVNVLNMSEEEFDALPESTQARLRGDFG